MKKKSKEGGRRKKEGEGGREEGGRRREKEREGGRRREGEGGRRREGEGGRRREGGRECNSEYACHFAYMLTNTNSCPTTDRYSPVPDMWASKPLSQEMRHVSDGGFKSEGGGVSASERNSASGALGLAMWALHKTDSIDAGVELLMQAQAGRAAMSVFCSLAGSIYGYNELPHVWVEILRDKKEWLSLADRIYESSVSLPPPSGPSLETPNKATPVISTTRIGWDM
jgi:hypothetical protein